jgi:hypothetical protein
LTDAEALFAEIVAAYEPGKFEHAEGLLRSYCELVVSSQASLAAFSAMDDVRSPGFAEALQREVAITNELVTYADLLHLWPLQEDEPIPLPS